MNFFLQITSGRGPEECGWVVARLLQVLARDGEASGLTITEIERIPGIASTLRSAIVAVEGTGASAFAGSWVGTVLWIGQSPFRPNHKRKNWYVGIEKVEFPEEQKWDLNRVRVETMRASGPGGQHVNKTCSAVRVTHLPTGLAAIAQDGRSQHQNRKIAMMRLKLLLRQKTCSALSASQKQRWDLHNQLERGNPIRIFEGIDFRSR